MKRFRFLERTQIWRTAAVVELDRPLQARDVRQSQLLSAYSTPRSLTGDDSDELCPESRKAQAE